MGKPWYLVAPVLLALLVGFVSGFWIERERWVASLPSRVSIAGSHAERLDQLNLLSSSRTRVVMLGDSITQRGEWSELLGEVVANRGLGGDTTRDVLARVASVPASAEKIFVMVGVGDLAGAHRPALDVAADTRRIVRALSPRKVVVQSVLFTTHPNLNGAIAELNDRNRAYCAAGACRYLELNDLFSRDGLLRTDMTVDGVHLVGKAYPLWAARVKALDRDP
jgi:hypothetical protein